VGVAPVEVDVADDLPLVVVDPGLLERVLANLVANARAASPAGRPIVVRGTVAGDRLVLRVIDHGPGIPVGERERIFAPFQRYGDRASDGLGLGLAIAKGFTEAMGGTITPMETEGGGLTITMDFPVAR
jgi:two-component system sensor histidine kinase KdpD